MMLSGVVSAVLAGQIISRTGRYRVVAIGGVSLLALGVYLYTRLDVHSSSTDALWFTVMAGAGLGATLPTFMICVQNAFPHHMLGVVTSSIQFSRNIGGAVGTAVLGSFMTIRLAHWISSTPPPEGLDTLSAPIVERLRDPQALMDPGAMARIRELAGEGDASEAVLAVEAGLRGALAMAMQDVFFLGLGIVLVAVAVTFFLREIPLRESIMESSGRMDGGGPE